MAGYEALLRPLRIKGLTIRNRFLSTSHAPGYAVGGNITERYRRYHAEKAKGGIGLTQFGGATAVSVENSFHYGQINGAVDEVIPQYRAMAAGIHAEGAACMIQLAHGGRRERWDDVNWLPAFSPSATRELTHGAFAAEMEDHDIRRVHADFAGAARRAQAGDLDGVELSFQAGTLPEQFLSPAMNRRSDRYGGSLENRLRFGLELLEAVRKAVGDDYVVGIRMPGDEMLKGGLSPDDCLAVARAYATSGLIDFISVVGAQATDPVSTALIWPTMYLPSGAYLPLASAIKDATDIAVFHATRITDLATAARAVADGHVDMVGMTRAFISDPHLARKMREGREDDIRQCVGSGYCVDRVLRGHDAVCIQNAATGREQTMPHVIARSANGPRRAVVAGAGPGGMEAARVLAARGHRVVLFERQERMGGQVGLAARAGWRESLSGITRWFEGQLPKLGVELRLGVEATAEAVRAEAPDIVVVATGGRPNPGWFEGRELAASVWDILSGEVEPGESVLLVDENGAHQGPSCAEFMAGRGAKVEVVTPDRALCTEMAETNSGAHMKELYRLGVVLTPDTRLARVYREGNGLVAVLENGYTGAAEERLVDQVVGDHGTLPEATLYFALKPEARNRGEVDFRALAGDRPQELVSNPDGSYLLYRVGDAWAGRNIHAAIYDSLRLCKDL